MVAQTATLWVHDLGDERFGQHEVVISPDHFPNISAGDLLEISYNKIAPGTSDAKMNSQPIVLIVQVPKILHDITIKQPQLQISISQQLATAFGLQARISVSVRKAEKASLTAEFITLSFRDQYISRSDMWKVKLALNNTCLYVGKKISSLGARVQVKELIINGKQTTCACIAETTKAIFRSESARTFIFIQMSKEMWEFATDGELYFEKCVDGFLPDLFSRWKTIGTTHAVSIVMFARIFFKEDSRNSIEDNTALSRDSLNRLYQDFYRVVVEWENRTDWNSLLIPLKREFIKFEKDVLQRSGGDGSFVLSGENSSAIEGNVLEAINLALNPFDKHYIDRDLLRTGLSIMVITPSPGLFEVDKKLCRLTTQRMIDNGIGCDIVSLAKPPLYTVPLFQFSSREYKTDSGLSASGVSHDSSSEHFDRRHGESVDTKQDTWDPLYFDDAKATQNPERVFYTIPHWVEMSHYDDGDISDWHSKFQLRCRLDELHNAMSGESSSYIHVEKLDMSLYLNESGEREDGVDHFLMYDQSVNNIKTHGRSKHTKSGDTNNGSYGQIIGRSYASGSQASNDGRHSVSQKQSGSWTQEFEPEEPYSKSFGASTGRLGDLSYADSQIRRTYGSRTGVGEDPRNKEIRVKSDTGFNRGLDSVTEGTLAVDRSGFGMEPSPSSNMAPIHIRMGKTSADRRGDRENTFDYELGRSQLLPGSESFKAGSSPGDPTRYMIRASPSKVNSFPTRMVGIRQNYINPCNPSKNMIRTSSHIRRWQHVVPNIAISPSKYVPITKWKSLTTPACLPLTTDFFPTAEELAQSYELKMYTVTSTEDIVPMKKGYNNELLQAEALLLDLVSQRLSQGFQLILSSAIEKVLVVEDVSTANTGASKFWGNKTTQSRTNMTPFYVSLGDQVHKLFFESSGQSVVEVRQYIRRPTYTTESITYKCSIWPQHNSGYDPTTAKFSYPTFGKYNWNTHDQFISGFEDALGDAVRFWRSRFLLVPIEGAPQTNMLVNPSEENLDEEELRLAGFRKFVELFEKARVKSGDRNLRTDGLLDIQLTTLSSTSYVREEWTKSLVAAGNPTLGVKKESIDFDMNNSESFLTKSSSVAGITSAMQDPMSGCPIKDRRWHFKLYENVFIGSECVQWMLRSFKDLDTREAAVEFGNELLNKGIFEHANKKHNFLDGHYFYRLNKDFVIAPFEKSSTTGLATPMSNTWFRTPNLKSNLSDSLANLSDMSINTKTPTSRPVELSRKLEIDVDPQRKSKRKENAILHFSTIHNSKNSYHFQLHWLTCSSRLIDDMVQNWARVAEKCNLKFVEAPLEQAEPFANDTPFQSVVEILLSANPPSVSELVNQYPSTEFQPQWFELELARRYGFVMDVEADGLYPEGSVKHSYQRLSYQRTQLIHRSGAAFLQILEAGKGFYWVNNRLYLASTATRGGSGGGGGGGGGNAPGVGAGQGGLVGGGGGGTGAVQGAAINPDQLRTNFIAACNDTTKLQALWTEIISLRTQSSAAVEVARVSEFGENAASSPEAAILPQ